MDYVNDLSTSTVPDISCPSISIYPTFPWMYPKDGRICASRGLVQEMHKLDKSWRIRPLSWTGPSDMLPFRYTTNQGGVHHAQDMEVGPTLALGPSNGGGLHRWLDAWPIPGLARAPPAGARGRGLNHLARVCRIWPDLSIAQRCTSVDLFVK